MKSHIDYTTMNDCDHYWSIKEQFPNRFNQLPNSPHIQGWILQILQWFVEDLFLPFNANLFFYRSELPFTDLD